MAGIAPDTLPLGPMHGVGSPQAPAPQMPMPGMDVDLGGEMPPVDPSMMPLPDGGMQIDFAPMPPRPSELSHNENLAELIDDAQLGIIAEDLLTGIEADEQSRAKWLETRKKGLELLALELTQPKSDSNEGDVAGVSQIRHPMLLEAVVRFQANARAELLPTDGPVKIRNDDPTVELEDNSLADALQKDMNHYLTVTATEFYPDTDKLLFRLGFGGSEFKKVYHCPLRRRPVSESVPAENLIVADTATDLRNAARVTHRIPDMKPSTLKRMQLVGAYRKVELSQPSEPKQNPVEDKIDAIQGIRPTNRKPEDVPFEILECYCELDIPGFEHMDVEEDPETGEQTMTPTGLALPYKVTIERNSRTILEIRRNWAEDDDDFLPKRTFVHYQLVPGFGFYAYGFLHMLGNITTAVTAAWRMMLDAGMFANFPGFLYAKSGAKQKTNVFRVAPGAGQEVDIAGMKSISDAIMPLPYREPGAAMMGLVDNIAQTGYRLGQTAEIQVGEGRQDAPVGTTIALIEQATKPLNAIHKRLYTAQAEELQMLVDLFREDPQALWVGNRRPKMQAPDAEARKQLLLKALEDNELVPVADPNTASHMERVMKATALEQLAQQHPDIYDLRMVQTLILQMINIGNADQLLIQEDPNAPPPPEAQEAMAKLEIEQQKVAIKDREVSIKEQEAQAKLGMAGLDMQGRQIELQHRAGETMAKGEQARLKAEVERAKLDHMQQTAALEARRAQLEHQRETDKLRQDRELAIGTTQAENARHQGDLDAKLLINKQDNETALEITDKEIASSEKVAAENRKAAVAKAKATGGKTNMKNGNGINPGRR